MELTIIVPIYNVEPYLRQCLDSLAAQSLRDVEILLVDDGSPDGCPAICDEYAGRDSRFRVIHKPNGGLVSARQTGFREARGAYIGFVDGDDWIEPDMFAELLRVAREADADMVQCEFYGEGPGGREASRQKLTRSVYGREELKREVFPRMIFGERLGDFGLVPSCWSKLFRRSILEQTLPAVDPAIRMGEDAAFTYPALLECKTLCYVDRPLYHYRRSGTSMTKSYDPDYWRRAKRLFAGLRSQAERLGNRDFQAQLDGYFLYVINFAVRNACSPSEQARGAGRALAKALAKDPEARGLEVRLALPRHVAVVYRLLRGGHETGLALYLWLFRHYRRIREK